VGKLKAAKLDESAWPEWDRLVARHPSGTLCHRTEWLSRVGEDLQVHVVVDGGGSVRAGVAVVETTKYRVRGFHVPPYTPYFGPLVLTSRKEARAARRSEDNKILGILLDSLPGAPHVDFKLAPGNNELYPFLWRGFTASVAFTHEVCGNADEYGRNISERRRTYLRRLDAAIAEGKLTMEVGAGIEPVIRLWEDAARRKSVAAKTAVLRKLADPSIEDWRWTAVCCRDAGGRLLSGVGLAIGDGRALNLVNATAASLPKGLEHANLAAMNAAIRHVLAMGLVFDLEGSMLPGVEEFYRLLGGVPKATYRLQRSRSILYLGMRVGAQLVGELRGRRR